MEITGILTEYIKNGTPFTFSKFGDGEYMCAANYPGANCDGDTYTLELRRDIVKAFIKTVEQGGFVGLWWHDYVVKYWESKVPTPEKIKWVNYHTVIIDKNNILDKIELYKSIKESKLKKIYIHNYLLTKVDILLKIDKSIIIDIRNWYKRKEELKEEIKREITEKSIIMTSAGIGSKILIQELKELYPENIYIDIGSALDLICTKRDSRGKNEYENHRKIFEPILPPDWEHPKYNYIYEEAKYKLGIHLN